MCEHVETKILNVIQNIFAVRNKAPSRTIVVLAARFSTAKIIYLFVETLINVSARKQKKKTHFDYIDEHTTYVVG